MKSVLVISLLLSQMAFSAAPTEFFCSGKNAEGEKVQVIVNLSAQTIDLNKVDPNVTARPPYFVKQQSWRVIDATLTTQKIAAEGRTTGFTTGRAGRIILIANRSRTAPAQDQIYNGKATITPAQRVLRPVVAQIVSLTCQVR